MLALHAGDFYRVYTQIPCLNEFCCRLVGGPDIAVRMLVITLVSSERESNVKVKKRDVNQKFTIYYSKGDNHLP